LCANPWPPYQPDGSWIPWRDNSSNCKESAAPGACSNTNFELYYCRDAGDFGTADDLPAILSNQAVIRGENLFLKCSDNTGSCAGKQKNDPCSDLSGVCDIDILKELFFFREALPDASSINLATVTNDEINQGGKAGLTWRHVAGAQKYKVYYGTSASSLTKSVSILDADRGTNAEPFIIDKLNNGTKYYFAVTATYSTGAESEYSNIVSFTPSDTLKPGIPQNLVVAQSAEATAVISWAANKEDTASYKIYYGVNSGSLGASLAVDKNKCSTTVCAITIGNLKVGTQYYFAVTALDGASPVNESDKTEEKSLTIALMKDLTEQMRSQADLIKILTAIGVKRDQLKTSLINVTGSGCSACVCNSDYGGGGDIKSSACAESMTKAFKQLGFPDILRDPWGDPYLIDENENDKSINPNNPCVSKDTLYSMTFNRFFITVPFYQCK
jgi:hypothetical protein